MNHNIILLLIIYSIKIFSKETKEKGGEYFLRLTWYKIMGDRVIIVRARCEKIKSIRKEFME